MADITLVRQHGVEASEQEKEAARRVVFGFVDGLGDRGRRQWRRLWGQLMRLEPGETLGISTHKARSGPYHRRHMAIEAAVFEAQERFGEFEAFRAWLKTGSGFVDWYPGPKGGVIPVPRSISYTKLEQQDMEQFHADAMAFLRTPHALRTLWPHLDLRRAGEALEAVMQEFGE